MSTKTTESQNNQFRKNFIWNLIGTTTNTLTSLMYMILITRLNGLEEAGVFSFAFSNACVLAVIGMYMGRTYQVSSTVYSEKVFLQTRKVTCALMTAVSAGMILIYGYPAQKAVVFLSWTLVKTLEAFADVLYAVLQRHDRLDCEGKSLTMKALLSITVFTVLDLLFRDILIASVGVLAASLLVLLTWDLSNYRKYRNPAASWTVKECKEVFGEGAFICATTLLASYLVNAAKYAINSGGTDSDQAVYGILVMPATAMNLVGQYLIQPFLMKISYQYHQKQTKEFVRSVLLMEGVLIGIGAVGILCAGTIGIPILSLVYGVGLSEYRGELMLVMAGAICYGSTTILTNILTVMNRNRIQTVCFAVLSLAVLVISGQVVKIGGIAGAVSVYFGSMLCAFLTLAFITFKNLKKEKFL